MNLNFFVDKIKKTQNQYDTNLFLNKGNTYSFINPYGYHLMRKNFHLYMDLDGILVDGILMCFFINLFYKIKIIRRSFDMTTVASDLFSYANKNNLSIYFVGARAVELCSAMKFIKESFPSLNILGYRDGYFLTKNDYHRSLKCISTLQPDFVVVGLGAIMQEKYVLDLKDAGYKGISFTCGGFLSQISTGIYYYPYWVNTLNLRAFYRFYKEPKTRKRLLNVIFQFPFLFIVDYLRSQK